MDNNYRERLVEFISAYCIATNRNGKILELSDADINKSIKLMINSGCFTKEGLTATLLREKGILLPMVTIDEIMSK